VVSRRDSIKGKGGSMATSRKNTIGDDSADPMEEIFLVGEENDELRMELHEIQEKDYETRQELGVVGEKLEQSNKTLEQAVFQSESLKLDRNKLRNDLDQIQTKYKRSATQRNKLSDDLETMSELLERRKEEISALGKKISDRDSKIEKFERLYKGGENLGNLAQMKGVIPEILNEDSRQSTPAYSGDIRPHRLVSISDIGPIDHSETLENPVPKRASMATLDFSQD
jgi:hypothetical protein